MLRTSNSAPAVFSALLIYLVMPMATAGAALIEIQFEGMNLYYDGLNIYDDDPGTNYNTTRSGDPSESDPLLDVTFLVDGSPVGSLSTDIFGDIFVDNVTGLSALFFDFVSVSRGGPGFGFDVLTQNQVTGFGLAQNYQNAQIVSTGGTVGVSLVGPTPTIVDQDLPFGISLDSIQAFSFISVNLSDIQFDGNGDYTQFRASGTGSIVGQGEYTLIPEPSTVCLSLLAASCLFSVGSRGRRRARV